MLTARDHRIIDDVIEPFLEHFAEAVAEMRLYGAGDEEIEAVVRTAVASCPGQNNAEVSGYLLEKLRAAAERTKEKPRPLN